MVENVISEGERLEVANYRERECKDSAAESQKNCKSSIPERLDIVLSEEGHTWKSIKHVSSTQNRWNEEGEKL